MDATFAQWVLGQVGVGGIAALALYLLNKAHQDARQRERDYAEMLRADRAELIRVVSEATRALTVLEGTIGEIVHDKPHRPS